MLDRYVRVSKIKKLPFKLPLEPSTFYKWHHLGRYPHLFKKIGGILLIDLEALRSLIEKSGHKQRERGESTILSSHPDCRADA